LASGGDVEGYGPCPPIEGLTGQGLLEAGDGARHEDHGQRQDDQDLDRGKSALTPAPPSGVPGLHTYCIYTPLGIIMTSPRRHRRAQECLPRCKNSRGEWQRLGSASGCGMPGRRSACRSTRSKASPGSGARISRRSSRKPSTTSPAPRTCDPSCARMPAISAFPPRNSSISARAGRRALRGNLRSRYGSRQPPVSPRPGDS